MSDIYGLTQLLFWLKTGLFGVALIVSWYGPGSWLLRRRKLDLADHYLLSFALGLVLWGVQGYLFGWLQLRFLSYAYLALSGWWLWQHRRSELQKLAVVIEQARAIPIWLWAIVASGTVLQLLPVFGSGLVRNQKIPWYGVNAYDGIMHLAYIQELAQHFPPREPGAVGLMLVNYHYWSDLVSAELARIWQLPIMHLYFQWLPLTITLLTTLALYRLVKTYHGSTSWAVWAIIMNYAAGDLAYVLSWLFHGSWGWHIAAIDNGATQFLNVPHTFAKFLLLAAVIVLYRWWHSRQRDWAIALVLLMGTLVGFKVYYGIFMALGLSLVVAGDWIKQRRPVWSSALVLAATAAVSLAIFLPVNRHAGGLFYAPLEWPKLLLGPEHLDLRIWWLRYQVYDAAQSNKGIMALNLMAVVFCLLIMHGTRLLGFLPTIKGTRAWGLPLSLFFIPGTLLFNWLGLYTLQVSGLFNVFNFFVVATIPLSLMSAYWLSTFWQWRSPLGKVLCLTVLALSLPRVLYSGWFYANAYANQTPAQSLSVADWQSLQLAKLQLPADALIQTHPYNEWNRITPAISYATNRSSYLTGAGMLETHNQPISDRQAVIKRGFTAAIPGDLAVELRQVGVTHVIMTSNPEEKLAFSFDNSEFKLVLRTPTLTIWAVPYPKP